MEIQYFIDAGFALIAFLGGWLLKVIFNQINQQRGEYKDLAEVHRVDHKQVTGDLTALAISLPSKYVSKDDLNEHMKRIQDRFDRLEEKIDDLKVK